MGIIALNCEPFLGSQGNIGTDPEGIFVLDDVDILDTEAFTGAQYSAGIVRLVDILQYNGKIPGPAFKFDIELPGPPFGNKLLQVFNQFACHGWYTQKKREQELLPFIRFGDIILLHLPDRFLL